MLREAWLWWICLIQAQALREVWPYLLLRLVSVGVDPPLIHTTAIIILTFFDAPLFPFVKAVQRNIRPVVIRIWPVYKATNSLNRVIYKCPLKDAWALIYWQWHWRHKMRKKLQASANGLSIEWADMQRMWLCSVGMLQQSQEYQEGTLTSLQWNQMRFANFSSCETCE